MRTNIHALSRNRTHGLSIQEIKAYASDSVATRTGQWLKYLDHITYENVTAG
jgi:hypothetical protein